MTKRFTDNKTNCLIDSSFTDNLTKKIYGIDEWERIIGLCNNLWNQTQRFEKENQRLNSKNEQLKQQLQIFEKFLEGNDLSIDWEEFCGLEECVFENPNFSCKTCIHLKGDV